MPKVSVIVPSYNHDKYIVDRLRSVYDQTFKDFDVWIYDDFSLDGSQEIIKQFCTDRDFTTVKFAKVNSGSPFEQWDRGIEDSYGEYIWIAESDDCAHSAFLEIMSKHLDQNPDVVLCFCAPVIVGAEWSYSEMAATIENQGEWKGLVPGVNSGKYIMKNIMVYDNIINNASGVLFRRSAYEKIPKDHKKMKYCGDWFVWSEMMKLGDIYYDDGKYNILRRHPLATTIANERRILGLLESVSVTRNILLSFETEDDKNKSQKILGEHYARFIWNNIKTWKATYEFFRGINVRYPTLYIYIIRGILVISGRKIFIGRSK